jgi:hypothetical protein
MNPLQMYTRALVGVHGATEGLAAVFSGDAATPETVEARRAICKVCPRMVVKVAPLAVAESSWCGEPLGGPTGIPAPGTCGCLVAVATLVGSKRCPSGKW